MQRILIAVAISDFGNALAICRLQSRSTARRCLIIFRKSGGSGGITHAAQHGDRCEHSHYTFGKSSPGLRLIFMRMPHVHPLKSYAITRLATRSLSSRQNPRHLLCAQKILTVLQLWKLEEKGLACVHPKCGKVG